MGWISSVLLVAAIATGAEPNGEPIGAQPEPRAAAEGGFRLETAVYVGTDPQPACRITTIFSGGTVYDCMTTPAETVVFEPWAGRFVLLSEKYHRQTVLATSDVKMLTDRLHQMAAAKSDPMAKFLAEPKFREEYDQAARELTLTSPLVTYDVTLAGEPDPAVIEQCRTFCDWSARLNAILKPGWPPFARMEVDAAIARRQATASRVYLIVSHGTAKREVIHSDHRIIRPLAPTDMNRIAEIRGSIASFKRIGFEQYRNLDLQ